MVVLAGEAFTNNRSSSGPAAELRELIEMQAGKVQTQISRKVTHVVYSSTQGTVHSSDQRVKSARKYGAKVVHDTFFKDSLEQKKLLSEADYMPNVDATAKAPHPIFGKKKRRTEGEEGDGSGKESGDEEGEGVEGGSKKKRHRKSGGRSKDESEWSKEYRERFGYAKEARNRQFDHKDTVVPGASVLRGSNGVEYRAYLMLDAFGNVGGGREDEEEQDEVHAKFFAIKLVEAGGLMRGEKWHVVTQWGKVGTQKPGCDVADFDDLRSAKARFNELYYQKTKNSWTTGADIFRAHPGKYTLVEVSDEEEGEESDEEVEFADSADARLWNLEVQGLVKTLVGKQALQAAVRGMHIDCEKLPLYKIKRHRVNSALAQLAEMQNLLRKVEYVHTLTVSMHTCILHVCFYVDVHVFFLYTCTCVCKVLHVRTYICVCVCIHSVCTCGEYIYDIDTHMYMDNSPTG